MYVHIKLSTSLYSFDSVGDAENFGCINYRRKKCSENLFNVKSRDNGRIVSERKAVQAQPVFCTRRSLELIAVLLKTSAARRLLFPRKPRPPRPFSSTTMVLF
jgi:hypothetical protein